MVRYNRIPAGSGVAVPLHRYGQSPVERRGIPLQIRQLVIQVDEFRSVRITLPYGKDTALQRMMLSLQEPVLVDPRLHTFGHNLVGG